MGRTSPAGGSVSPAETTLRRWSGPSISSSASTPEPGEGDENDSPPDFRRCGIEALRREGQRLAHLPIPGVDRVWLASLLSEDSQLVPGLRRRSQVAALFADACRFLVVPFSVIPL